ncbi:MAG: LysR family transcriptional regulator [Betaproteobacteria bacterium]|nr:LysR family transcriptional regulator [Betaproteobacteria bacterium]
MDRLHGILVFLRVVENGTLSGAARMLGVSTSAVSAALARLEKKLEVRLLNRTTRRLSVTAEGAEFYARCKQVANDLEEAELVVGRAGRVPSGKLCVGLPSVLGRTWIIPHLPEFVRVYPLVSLEIVCSDFVPHTIEDGLDVAVQIGDLHASRLAARRLASTRYVVCASPGYFADRGVPRVPEDLSAHACLMYRRPRNGRLREWRFKSGTSVRHLHLNAFMTFNSGDALIAAAAAGLGIIQVAEHYVRSLLENGELTEVLANRKAEGYDIFAVFPQQQPIAPKLRVFVDFLVALFNRPPWGGSDAPARLAAVQPE